MIYKKTHLLKKTMILALVAIVAADGIIPLSIAQAAEPPANNQVDTTVITQQVIPNKSDKPGIINAYDNHSAINDANLTPDIKPTAGNGIFRDVPLPDQIPDIQSNGPSTYNWNYSEQPPQISTFSTRSRATTSSNGATSKSVTYVMVTSDVGLNVRKGPGTNNPVIGKLGFGEQVKYLGKATANDGSIWYKIQCTFGTGYGHSNYLEKVEEYKPSTSFEAELNKQGFPDSYKKLLRQVHAQHPSWHFVADKTNLPWEVVISRETSPVSINLVSHIRPDTWKSVEPGSYNPSTNQYISYDSGGWIPADKMVVQYYMDPRNFLNSGGIFQFMSNKYDPATASAKNVAGVTSGTFMRGTFPEKVNKKTMTYNQVIADIGKKTGVNPMVIASIIVQEQGANGGGRSISGTVSGYKGYYNHFNIGAYQTSSGSAVVNGLKYAKTQGWNSRYKSILGGAKWFADRYVNNKKHNSYLKKFNVMSGLESVGRGQYMTNIEGAYQEGVGLRNGYRNMFNAPLTFSIPIYRSMPSSPCRLPVEKGTHINFLRSMYIKGVTSSGKVSSNKLKLSPTFDPRTQSYTATAPDSATKVQVSYAGSDPSVKVSIAEANSKHQVSVPIGTKKISIKVTATSGRYRYYRINVTRKGGDKPKPSPDKPKPNPDKPKPPAPSKPKPNPSKPAPIRPAKVTGIKLRTDYTMIKVSFNKSKSNKVSGYKISYREIALSGKKQTYGPWKYITTKSTSYLIKGLKTSGFYGIRVAAINSKDNIRSYYSDERKVYANRKGISYAVPYYSKITRLTVGHSGSANSTTNGTAKITCKVIKYTNPTMKISYRYRYKQKNASKWNYITTTSNIRTIKGLRRGKTYTFQVAHSYVTPLDGKTVFKSNFMGTKNVKI